MKSYKNKTKNSLKGTLLAKFLVRQGIYIKKFMGILTKKNKNLYLVRYVGHTYLLKLNNND